jgi:hypothetical protein
VALRQRGMTVLRDGAILVAIVLAMFLDELAHHG